MEAFILVGGRGSRLHPYTEIIPKSLIPVDGKPFLWYIVERLLSSGFNTVTLLVAEEDLEIFQHEFRDCPRVFFVPSGRLGTAGAFCVLKGKITSPFIVIYGDLLTVNVDYAEFYNEASKILPKGGAVLLASEVTRVPWGIITSNRETITFQEKPELELSQWTGTALVHDETLQHVFPLADWGADIFPKIPLKAIFTKSEILHITNFNDIEPISKRLIQIKKGDVS